MKDFGPINTAHALPKAQFIGYAENISPFDVLHCAGCAGDVPVIVVGGGAALCGDTLAGAAAVIRPAHADVANAVGAAIPQVHASYTLGRNFHRHVLLKVGSPYSSCGVFCS